MTDSAIVVGAGSKEDGTGGAPSSTSALAWVARGAFVIACVVGLIALLVQYGRPAAQFPGAAVLAIVLNLLVGAIAVALIRWARPIHKPVGSAWLWALLWGATAASGIAMLLNGPVESLWTTLGGQRFGSAWGDALTAPITEETCKVAGIALLAVAAPAVIRGPIDGLIYGALAGLGFEVMENLTYAINQIFEADSGTSPWEAVTESFIVRVGLTELGSHWAMSAVAGTAVGYLAARGKRAIGLAAGLFVAAMAMHWLFDSPLLHDLGGTEIKTGINFIAVVTLYLALRRGYRRRARRVLLADVEAGAVTEEQAVAAFTRRGRRRELHRAPRPERPAVRARQQALLGQIDLQATDALTFARTRRSVAR